MGKQKYPEDGLFSRFKKSLISIFYKSQENRNSHDFELAKEVQRNADEVLNQLSEIKNDLKKTIDGKLFTYVEDVVDPIAARIRSITNKLEPEKEQVQAFDQWINKKVKPLVEGFSNKSDDRKEIEKTILQHAMEVCAKQIDTDIKVIRDDEQHRLATLDVSEQEKLVFHERFEEALAPLLQRWKDLAIPPRSLTLDKLSAWKADVDRHRNRYYQVAMDLIDTVIPEPSITEELHDHLIQNFQEIEDLERELPELIQELQSEEINSHNALRLMRKLDQLEAEAIQLEQDLRLTPELFERLETVKKGLMHAQKIIVRYQ